MASSFPQPDEIYFNLNNAQRKESPHCESGAKHFWHPHSMSSVHYRHFAEFIFHSLSHRRLPKKTAAKHWTAKFALRFSSWPLCFDASSFYLKAKTTHYRPQKAQFP
jgi:hypothetical protein